MPKRPQTEKQRLALEHGRAVRKANLEAKQKARKSRERTLDLSTTGDDDQSTTDDRPVKQPAKSRSRKRSTTAPAPERTEETPRKGGGFLGGLVDAFRS